jgi:hypothetical protein
VDAQPVSCVGGVTMDKKKKKKLLFRCPKCLEFSDVKHILNPDDLIMIEE